MSDPNWLADHPELSTIEFISTRIELSETGAGPFVPPKLQLFQASDYCPFLRDGSLGRLLQGSEIDTLWLIPANEIYLAPGELDLAGIRDVKVRQIVIHMGNTISAEGAMGQLAGQTSLESLILLQSFISANGLAFLGSLTNLSCLWLENEPLITDADLVHLLPVKKLEQLSLKETKLTDACLPTLAKLPRLKVLNISGTRIKDIDGLSKLPALTHLISDEIFSEAEREELQNARPGLSFEEPEDYGISVGVL